MLRVDTQVSRLTDMHNYKCTECDSWLVRIRKQWVCRKCIIDKLEDE